MALLVEMPGKNGANLSTAAGDDHLH